MTSDSHSILSRKDLAWTYSGLKPKVVRSPEQTTRSGSMPVDVLPEPVAEIAELRGTHLVVEVRELTTDSLPELAGDDVPERVGREVAERPARPVHVLEHPVGHVGHVDPEILLHLRVPRLRRVGRGESAGEQVLLELEAQNDGGVVGAVVGVVGG